MTTDTCGLSKNRKSGHAEDDAQAKQTPHMSRTVGTDGGMSLVRLSPWEQLKAGTGTKGYLCCSCPAPGMHSASLLCTQNSLNSAEQSYRV